MAFLGQLSAALHPSKVKSQTLRPVPANTSNPSKFSWQSRSSAARLCLFRKFKGMQLEIHQQKFPKTQASQWSSTTIGPTRFKITFVRKLSAIMTHFWSIWLARIRQRSLFRQMRLASETRSSKSLKLSWVRVITNKRVLLKIKRVTGRQPKFNSKRLLGREQLQRVWVWVVGKEEAIWQLQRRLELWQGRLMARTASVGSRRRLVLHRLAEERRMVRGVKWRIWRRDRAITLKKTSSRGSKEVTTSISVNREGKDIKARRTIKNGKELFFLLKNKGFRYPNFKLIFHL